jgi:hypothetical protein
MKTLSITAILLAALAAPGLAQLQNSTQPKAVAQIQTDAQWAKSHVAKCSAGPDNCGLISGITGDQHFLELLRHSLPQSDSWWVNDYRGHSSVTNAVLAFLGMPEATYFDDDRYLTITGCVPHVCPVKGMLWIDTGTHPSTVIFVGEDGVAGSLKGESGYHVYLYTSREITTYYAGKRHIEIFAPEFLKSLARWHDASISKYDDQKIILVTIVWPNGATHDLFWSDLLKPSTLPANNSGANQ